MRDKKVTAALKTIANSRFPEAQAEVTTRIFERRSGDRDFMCDVKRLLSDRDLIMAYALDGEESSFRFHRVPVSAFRPLLNRFLNEHPRLSLEGDRVFDHSEAKYTPVHIPLEWVESYLVWP
jgi:hypothetical protein